MKFNDLTPEQQEMFMESPYNEGSSVEYCLFWVWDWETLELITEDNRGFITVYRYNTKEELAEVIKQLDEEHHSWLESLED